MISTRSPQQPILIPNMTPLLKAELRWIHYGMKVPASWEVCNTIRAFRNTENALAHLPEASVARTCWSKNDAVLIAVPLTVPEPQVHPSQEDGAVRQRVRAGAGSSSDSSTRRWGAGLAFHLSAKPPTSFYVTFCRLPGDSSSSSHKLFSKRQHLLSLPCSPPLHSTELNCTWLSFSVMDRVILKHRLPTGVRWDERPWVPGF